MGQKRWYVVQSKPQKEAVVFGQLQRNFEQFETFLPKIRNHLGVRPLFPSYLFVKTEMEEYINFQNLKFTRGLLRILSTKEGRPISVSSEVIEVIQGYVGSDGLIDQSRRLQIGQWVKVQRGPLKDLIGILEKPVIASGRVQVLFKLLKYQMRAILKFEDLAIACT